MKVDETAGKTSKYGNYLNKAIQSQLNDKIKDLYKNSAANQQNAKNT